MEEESYAVTFSAPTRFYVGLEKGQRTTAQKANRTSQLHKSLPFRDHQISEVQGFQNSQTNETAYGNNNEAMGGQTLFTSKDFF